MQRPMRLIWRNYSTKICHEEAIYIYKLLDKECAAEKMLKLDEDVRKKLLSGLTSRGIAEGLIKNIDSDDATDVISELLEKKAGRGNHIAGR